MVEVWTNWVVMQSDSEWRLSSATKNFLQRSAVIGAHKFGELARFGGRADRMRIHVSISPAEDQPRLISNCPILSTDLPMPSSALSWTRWTWNQNASRIRNRVIRAARPHNGQGCVSLFDAGS